MSSSFRLPKSFSRYFWDIKIRDLNPQKNSQYIIQRLLEKGDEKAVRWLRKKFRRTELIKAIKERRGFSSETVNFWASFWQIPVKQIKCLQKHYRKQRRAHWPY